LTLHGGVLQSRPFFGGAPSGAESARSGSGDYSGSAARSTLADLPVKGAPPAHMRDAPMPPAPAYNGVSKAMSVIGMSGVTGGTMAMGGASGVTTATESPYQAVDTAALDASGTVAVSATGAGAEVSVDVDDPVAVLHAQLDHFEKYRGGVVLGAYRCAALRCLTSLRTA
jgi:hypothetical protein